MSLYLLATYCIYKIMFIVLWKDEQIMTNTEKLKG